MILADAAATQATGSALGMLVKPGDVVTLSGDLGAGKTSLARGMLTALGLKEEAPSPSYALVIPYEPPDVSIPVWHVDLYRLAAAEEEEELGLDEVLGEGALLVEWPERIGAMRWPDALRIHIAVREDGRRALTADVPPSWKARWPFT